ncbi:low affinity iron permease family protein [Methylobacterium planeticum]|nr:low affinity iron permease family protein [Methylobacterium planeticum]
MTRSILTRARVFTAFASSVAHAAGRPSAFALCLVVILAWAVSGPFFHYSDTWQLIINTGTTIVTFLMVFLIQNTQNRDGAAIQAKLDELIRASAAHNRYIGIESLTEEELRDLRDRCASRARSSRQDAAQQAAQEAANAAEVEADRKARAAAQDAAGMPSYPE